MPFLNGPDISFEANAPCTQHNFKNSKNTLYFGNENLKLKIMHSREKI